MKKLEYDEIGILITREIKAMLMDGNISFENRGKIMYSIITGDSLDDPMMRAFADSLRSGYVLTNNKRKAEITSRRERQKNYAKKANASTHISEDERASTNISVDKHGENVKTSTVDERASTEIDAHLRLSPPYNRTEQNRTEQNSNIPLYPPRGDGNGPKQISADDILGITRADPLEDLADRIEATEAFGHMRVKRRKLLRALRSVCEKNTAAEILEGIAKWTEVWAAEGWEFCPGSISDWISDGKFLQVPREKKEAGDNYDDVGVKEIV